MLVTCCRMDGMIYNNGEEKINHSNYSSKKQKCGTHCNTSDTVSALPSPVTSRRIRSFGHTKWMFPSKLNVSLKSFDFDEHFKKVSEKFLATVHYSVSLPPLMQYCETCLWMPLHSNKGLSETKFSSCSLIFFLKQKNKVLNFTKQCPVYLTDITEKAKGQLSIFPVSWQRCLWLVWPIGKKNFTEFRFGRNLLDSLVTFCCLIQGSNIISVPTRRALCQENTGDNVRQWSLE